MKATAEQQLRILARVQPVLAAVCKGFTPDPGTSDLDDEQPIVVWMTLGDYRRATRLNYELKKEEN